MLLIGKRRGLRQGQREPPAATCAVVLILPIGCACSAATSMRGNTTFPSVVLVNGG
jgi:hypothetical protein